MIIILYDDVEGELVAWTGSNLRVMKVVEISLDFLEGILPISSGGDISDISEVEEKYLGTEAKEAF